MVISSAKSFQNIKKSYGYKTAFRAVAYKLTGKPVSNLLPAPPEPEMQVQVKVAEPNYFDWHGEWFHAHRNQLEKCPPVSAIFKNVSVAIIADLNLPQCKKYRVMQKLEAFRNQGISANFCHWTDQPRAFNIMQCATHYLFYRIPDCPLYDAYIAEAKRLGGTSLYDIDDPIFDKEVYELNRGLDFITKEEKSSLLRQVPRYVSAIKKADISIASTPGIQKLMRSISNKPVIIWRNLVDQQTVLAADLALAEKTRLRAASSPSDRLGVRLGYMSGSRAHEADFREASADIAKIMKKFEDVTMKVVGHLVLPEELEPFRDRIMFVPFSDYNTYISHFADVDINILPLSDNEFNECKSAIRYLEAAMVQVPTVVTNVGDFKYVAADGKTASFVNGNKTWASQIELLIRNPKLREKIGKAAYSDVNKRFLLDHIPNSANANFTLPANETVE